MNICLIHGYLLTGTGSNTFTQNLARYFCRLGHNVYLLCQEPNPEKLDFVTKTFVFVEGNTSFKETSSKETPYPGKCFIFRPDIAGLILVYVADRYGKLRVKRFNDASLDEIERYIGLNTRALTEVLARYPVDVVQANHMIASPTVARRATRDSNIPYFITLHGSAFNFSVRRDERLRPYAREGLKNARKVFVESEHNRRGVIDFFLKEHLDLESKIMVIPCGVDTERFNLIKKDKEDNIKELKTRLAKKLKKSRGGKTARLKEEFNKGLRKVTTGKALEGMISEARGKYNERFPDSDIADKLTRIDWQKEKIVLFGGKYMWSKGVQLIIGAIPLILKKVPEARFIFVGFGGGREALEVMVAGLNGGDKRIFYYGLTSLLSGHEKDNVFGGIDSFQRLFQAEREKRYFELARSLKISEKVTFGGILDHEELRYLMPCADVFVAPSIFPEAFGIVAIEALACGVWPVLTYQSGLKEIEDILAAEFKQELGKIKKLEVGRDIITLLSERIVKVLKARKLQSNEIKERLRKIASERFGWPAVVGRYLEEFKINSD